MKNVWMKDSSGGQAESYPGRKSPNNPNNPPLNGGKH